MARIAVGGFQHETNTFAPQRATWADFERADAWPGFVRGPELIDAVEGFNIPIAGAVKTLQELGHDLVPLCWCSAPPSSYVERDAYETVAGAMLEDLAAEISARGSLDGIYLDLHGAMVAEHHEDGEGELLRRIRALVGDRMPIVTSLDYHTNMTPKMVRHATAMVGYRTYPHIDMAKTGDRAAQLLDRLLKDRRLLYKAYRQIDFLIPLVWQCTLAEPAKGIFELIDEIEQGSQRGGGSNRGLPGSSHNQGIVSITHTPGFPPADIKECGPALVVYGLDRDAADAAAGRFTGTGPMYGGAKFQIGPMALVTDEASGVSAVLASKRIQANDKEMFRHVGVEPAEVPILGLKSTVHFRADFQPIAEAILCVNSPGAHVSDPAELSYSHLRPGIRLRPMGPTRA